MTFKDSDFVNLHLHSMYSIQDSVIKIPKLAMKLNEYGQSACAITDHSSCAGWIEFNDVMQKILSSQFLEMSFIVEMLMMNPKQEKETIQ